MPVAACPNPWFPLEEGLRLTYRAGRSSRMVLATKDVAPVPEGLRGTLAVSLKGRDGQTEVTCSAEGVSTALGGLEGTLLSASGMNVEVVHAEGVAVPAPSVMVPGGTWKNSLSVKLQPPPGKGGPHGLRPIIATTFDKEATVVGEEEVTVGAGRFKALKVRNLTTARASRPGAEGRTLESFIWFAPGVGIVKISTAGNTDLELLQVERPEPKVEPANRKGAPRKKAATKG
ncbi:hypothetical protein DRW03_23395 [Corallococcus sp. H22C18031201]|uniref:hypothetical protein n=1 Tax=Citreicoccus inhibens TaxID=2849499 RepID=UPI000E73B523|nr:hypothetical protein [Citreicoccus inhibens]MBU8897621.1 hypothetical protein [Citreicoccus inhibens]RJS19300.1 hypothetical protein DRW03_23395 [Corallococcus sp. H22C18031201]